MSKKLTITHLYWLWLVSLVSFVAAIFIVRRTPESFSSASLIVFALIVIFGAVSYLALIVNVLKQIRSRKARIMGMVSIATFACFFWLLFNFENVEAKLGFPGKVQHIQNTATTQPKLSNSPTPVPSQIPKANSGAVKKITCTGPDGKTFQTTQEECTAFNAAWGKDTQKNNSANANTNSSSREACVLGGKVYMLTRESCADFQKQNQDERIRQQAEVAEFNAEFEKDAEKRAEEKALRDLEYAVDMYENEKRLHDQCLRDAQSIKITLGSKCNNEAIYPTQAFRDDCWTKAEQGYARAVANCN